MEEWLDSLVEVPYKSFRASHLRFYDKTTNVYSHGKERYESMKQAHRFCICWVLALETVALSQLALAQSMPPRIFYSDIDSGPSSGGENNGGLYVTIYGNGFGASQNSSYVTIGGGQASSYKIWTNSKISFQLETIHVGKAMLENIVNKGVG